MKNLVFPLVVLFQVMLFVAAGAQDKKYEIVLGGGIDSPLRPESFTDEFNLGWTGKLAAGYFFTPQLTLGANLSYNRFGLNEDNFVTIQDNPEISGGDLTIFELAGVAKYYFMPSDRTTSFYLLGGPGIAFSRTPDFTFRNVAGDLVTVEGEDDTDLMLTAGGGVKYKLTERLDLFVEGRYSHVFTKNENISYLPIRVGVIF